MIYLDNAATSWPKPPGVSEPMTRFLAEDAGSPNRSGHRMAATAERIVLDVRKKLAKLFGVHYMKVVPSTDPNITMSMALAVFVLIIYYSIKCKGLGGFLAELSFHPFPSKLLIPVNFVLEFVTLIAKPLSLGLRLFGNLYAGEMIFVLIAIMFSAGIGFALAGGVFQFVWAVFHLIIITLQAFVFAVLTIVYMAQAHDVEEH